MWTNSLLPEAFARAFAEAPPEEIWEWADEHVTLCNEDAAEPGPYRSAKTPWTRRLQELLKNPIQWVWDQTSEKWISVSVTEINIMKSSQSGVSEACLNGIRWLAQFRPVNTIYAIDTLEEAKKIARRLLRSLKLLDPDIFTGDPDDIKSSEFLLQGMELLFYGSFSSGKYANKQAPLVITDELEEHGQINDDTSSSRNLASRKKTADNGLQVNISKPKKTNGPIHRAHGRGNQEAFCFSCPHCNALQPFTFFREEWDIPYGETIEDIRDAEGNVVARSWRPLPPGKTRRIRTGRIVFKHCKDLLDRWDKLRILRETYYECGACEGKIEEEEKAALMAEGLWLPMAAGTPGTISQHINDLKSEDKNSRWGAIVLEYLDAKREGRKEVQGVYNHRFGLAFSDEVSKTGHQNIKDNIAGQPGDGCPPYKRGEIPFVPLAIVLGADIGGNYAKWAIQAVLPNAVDTAVIDWGEEIDPDAVAEIINTLTWPGPEGKRYRVAYGFMDAKYRKIDAYRACLAVPNLRLIPCAGLGGSASRINKAWSFHQIPTFPRGFNLLSYNDRDAKDELYIMRIKDKSRRIFFPTDVANDPVFIDELCAEELIEGPKGQIIWNPYPPPNHYGDCVKNGLTGFRFLTRKQQNQKAAQPASTV